MAMAMETDGMAMIQMNSHLTQPNGRTRMVMDWATIPMAPTEMIVQPNMENLGATARVALTPTVMAPQTKRTCSPTSAHSGTTPMETV